MMIVRYRTGGSSAEKKGEAEAGGSRVRRGSYRTGVDYDLGDNGR